MLVSKQERKAVHRFLHSISDGTSALGLRNGTSGQAVVEFALMVPLVFLLIVNAFNFCSFIYCWITVADAVRAGADYACEDSSTADAPATPTITQITSVIQNATSGLPNYSTSNPAISVCEYDNGTSTNFLTSTACGSSYGNPPADPEATTSSSGIYYSTVAVDVTYTFSPFLSGNTFLRFGLPSLPTTIHRRMVVRWP